MHANDTMKRHAALVDDMARTLGVDLEESVLRAEITPEEVVDAVLNCTGCTSPETCRGWLEATDSAEAPPEYCRNKQTLAALRP